MSSPASVVQSTVSSRAEHVFPTLTPEQIARLAIHGRARSVVAGEVLVKAGQQARTFFVITSGQLDVVQMAMGTERVVASFLAGQFTGEATMLSGARGLATIRAVGPTEVIEIDRRDILRVIQTDVQLGEILMRAFILRRVELIAQGSGDVILAGSNFCQATLRVKEFLTRNGHPYTFVDLDRDPGVQALLDQFAVGAEDVPVLICRGTVVLRNPTNSQIADCLGLNVAVDQARVRDVLVIGAGPAGLAAAAVTVDNPTFSDRLSDTFSDRKLSRSPRSAIDFFWDDVSVAGVSRPPLPIRSRIPSPQWPRDAQR